ncbi:ABCB1, partial [Acrasis kona]
MGVIPVIFFYFMGNGLGSLTTASPAEVSRVTTELGLNITYIAIASAFCGFLSNFFFSIASQLINNKIKQSYYESCIKQEVGFFDIKKGGALAHALSDDCNKATDVYSTHLQTFTQSICQVIAGFILAMVTGYAMALIALSSVPLMILIMGVFRRLLGFLATKTAMLTSDSVATANEVIGSMRTVRSMGGEEKEIERYTNNLNKVRYFALFNSLMKGLTLGPIFFFIWGAISLASWFGGQQLQAGNYTVSTFVKIFGFSVMQIIGLIQCLTVIPEFIKAQASSALLLKVILRKPGIPFRGGASPDNLVGKISFKDVTFRYPARPNVAVLKNF